MGLAVRIIPTLLQRGPTLVKGKQFDAWRSVGHVAQAFAIHQAREVDELIYLDIAATPEGRGPNFELVQELTKTFMAPLTVGGGVRGLDDACRLLACGADKVAIRTNVHTIANCAAFLGSQAIVAAIDVSGNGVLGHPAFTPAHFAELMQNIGAGEILLTSVEREGTLEGYDLDLIREVCERVSIPVIAHGGCSGYDDMLAAIQAGASAVAAGALFQFTDCTPQEAAEYLGAQGIETRMPKK